MRINVNKDHPKKWIYATPYLNGTEVPHCVIADEEKGEIYAYVMDSDNKYIRDLSTGEPIPFKFTGKVQIVKKMPKKVL